MNTTKIKERYDVLASSCCSLSCGGNIDHVKPQKGETCLDLGCGRGNELMELAQSVGEHGKAIGIDASTAMLEKASLRTKELNLQNVQLICADLTVLPIEDSQVDVVISNCVLNHLTDKQLIWDEMFRVMKPGARFVVSDIYSAEEIPEPWCSDPVSIAECWAGAVTKDEYLKIVSKSGFTNLAIVKESKPYEKGKALIVSITIKGEKGLLPIL